MHSHEIMIVIVLGLFGSSRLSEYQSNQWCSAATLTIAIFFEVFAEMYPVIVYFTIR